MPADQTMPDRPLRIRLITDGKAGDLAHAMGVAEALAALRPVEIEERRVAPRPPLVWIMPWGFPDPRDRGAHAPPYPDIAIATGRRTVTSLRALKRRSPGTFTVFLKDPYTGPQTADFIWVPAHDKLRGENVLVTVTSPHRLTPERLAAAQAAMPAALGDLPTPRVAVLLGGSSREIDFTQADIDRFGALLRPLARSGAGLMVTPSRRTSPALIAAVKAATHGCPAWIWDGTGDNPYLAMLAVADAFVVTGDSVNMVGEALSRGKPVMAFRLARLPAKHNAFLDALVRDGAVANFDGRLETGASPPLNSTPVIAQALLRRFEARASWLRTTLS